MSKKRIWLILGTLLVIGAVLCGLLALRGCEAPAAPETASPRPAAETANRPAPMPEAPEHETGADEEPSPVQDDTGAEETALDSQTPPEVEAEPYVSPIDFAALQGVNPDIYAWLEIPGTEISYPLLQHPEDDAFYLDHDSDGNYSANGALFTERAYNGRELEDPVTVIYGHHMRSGAMFGNLERFYTDDAFMAEHGEVVLYTPEAERRYAVFAAVPFTGAHLLYYHDFTDPEVFAEFFASVFRVRDLRAHFMEENAPEAGDRVVILSTCLAADNTQRFLLMAAERP